MAVLIFGYYTSLLLSFTISLLVYLVIAKWYRERNYPPGPMGLPLIGYMMFLGANPHLKFGELRKKYGDIFSLYLGPTLHIIINDFKMAKEILNDPQCMARPEHFFDFVIGNGGFGSLSGEEWQDQRRFTFYTMRNLGLGKGPWEHMIQETVVDFVEEVKSYKGKPLDVETIISSSQASNGISLLIGRHLDKKKDAANYEIIRKSTRELMKYFSAVTVNVSIPGLSKVMKALHIGGYDKFFKLLRQFENIFLHEVEERMKNPDSASKEDFIGYYCREMEKRESESKTHNFSVINLTGNLFLLFLGANDTTVASLSWILLLMADRQDVQKKVQDEIDDVLGRDGLPSYEDRNKFPYTQATILEMHRWVSIAPTFPPRHLIGNLFLLFVAGNDSTVASLSWSLLLMADRPDIQKKVQDEIDSVLGRDGLPSYDDRNKFPYTMATILEMLRWAVIAPVFPPRHLYKDFTYNGYTFPKGSNIITNAHSVMRDPKYFEDPDEFKPERFLSKDKKKVTKQDGYIAFSLGKRNCPGEGVAMMTIFLYFISIMQKFQVKLPPGCKADMTPVFGGALLPKPHKMCFIER